MTRELIHETVKVQNIQKGSEKKKEERDNIRKKNEDLEDK